MARRHREPTIERRSHRCADGSTTDSYSVRYFDSDGARRRIACGSPEEADFERARLVFEQTREPTATPVSTVPVRIEQAEPSLTAEAFWPVLHRRSQRMLVGSFVRVRDVLPERAVEPELLSRWGRDSDVRTLVAPRIRRWRRRRRRWALLQAKKTHPVAARAFPTATCVKIAVASASATQTMRRPRACIAWSFRATLLPPVSTSPLSPSARKIPDAARPGANTEPARWRAVRRWLKTPATIAIYRSRIVRESLRFCARETLGRQGHVAAYRVRGTRARIVLRHRTRDLEIFHELIVADAYRPPAPVVELMARISEPRIVDLGANIGLFGVRALSRWPAATLTAYEPDPENVKLLERCIALNGAQDRWRFIAAFAATRSGEVRFRPGMESYSRQARPDERDEDGIITVPMLDAFDDLSQAHLLKMDIEGAEWEILSDPRLRASELRAIVLEYHDLPNADPHEEAERLLCGAGFTVQRVHRDEQLGLGMLWGWRTASTR